MKSVGESSGKATGLGYFEKWSDYSFGGLLHLLPMHFGQRMILCSDATIFAFSPELRRAFWSTTWDVLTKPAFLWESSMLQGILCHHWASPCPIFRHQILPWLCYFLGQNHVLHFTFPRVHQMACILKWGTDENWLKTFVLVTRLFRFIKLMMKKYDPLGSSSVVT